MPRIILRLKDVLNRLACGKTKFDDDYRHHSDDDPYVPGTNIPRVKPIPLGERNIGYLEHEVDELIDALAKLRDARRHQRLEAEAKVAP
jgi:predicted DNA-binding transcriptional regulator AlpA